ncbi:TetR/AcrR family transcriptional regulator [Dysgonomonas sp. 511]|uniref:TetR/AcrR family transcriptional regulator n=1 Tax=Dysgonomonas sp. 511 TaxID=2302930 RepID=UPI001C878157|nr:TetR/AcrR family transcriptional regulator [Dysgonomonas sp. 511]
MADSKKQILQTALKLFLKNSYKEVSLRDIVNEVGLAKGAFYHYYSSKDELFEEVVKYFYNNAIIANYSNFPKQSLEEFYKHYLNVLQEPDDFDEIEEDRGMNIFTFLSDAAKRIPDFLEIHTAQRKKERWAWTEIIETAKRNKEIKTNIKNEELASLFLKISDGIVIDQAISKEDNIALLKEMERDWDNLYSLLKTNK